MSNIYFAKDGDGRIFMYTTRPTWDEPQQVFVTTDMHYMAVKPDIVPVPLEVGQCIECEIRIRE